MMNDSVKNLIIAGSSFTGGLVLGYLFAGPREKKKMKRILLKAEQVLEKTRQKSRVMKLKSSESLRSFSGRVKKELRDPIPDLYKATESLTLHADDLLNGR